MQFEFINFHVEAQVAHLVLNRPDVLNSFNQKMGEEVLAALAQVSDRPEIRSLLLTGAGRGFSAGQDLSEVARPKNSSKPPLDLGDLVANRYNRIVLGIRKLRVPVICAVNGVAAGAGANIALACDIVVAAESASFIQSFGKIGLIPDSGGTFFLPRLVGFGRASAMMMLGEKIGAKEAERIGLIYKAVPDNELAAVTKTMSEQLAQAPTFGLWQTKLALNDTFSHELEHQLERERELQSLCGKSDDYTEGVTAFLEKRSPRFTGR